MGVDWIDVNLQAGLQQVRCTGLCARLILVSYHKATSRDRARSEFFYPLLSLPSDDPLQCRSTSSVRFGRSKPLLSTSVRVSSVDASHWSTRPPSMDLPTAIDLYPGTGLTTTPAAFSTKDRKYQPFLTAIGHSPHLPRPKRIAWGMLYPGDGRNNNVDYLFDNSKFELLPIAIGHSHYLPWPRRTCSMLGSAR